MIVGGGNTGTRKAETLLSCRAHVTILSPDLSEGLQQLVDKGKVDLIQREYRRGDLENYFLVIGATNSWATNELIFKEAQERGILCNVVDSPEMCTFFVPATFTRGDLKIAISTNGKSPALAREIRMELEERYGSEYETFLDFLGRAREELKRLHPNDEVKRRAVLERMVRSDVLDRLRAGEKTKFEEEINRWI